jgi:hypothetical protein
MLVYPAKRTQRQARSKSRRHFVGFAELLIDCEEDRTLRAVLVEMLLEGVKVRLDSRSHREPASRLP